MSIDVQPRAPSPTMTWIPGREFAMGSNDFYPEERPARRAAVDGFWMDLYPVTAGEFRRVVRETGYVTVAVRRGFSNTVPGALGARDRTVGPKRPHPNDPSGSSTSWPSGGVAGPTATEADGRAPASSATPRASSS